MPIYPFRCECGETFEEYRAMADAGEPAHCPACQSTATRVFTTAPVRFRPEGYYRSPEDPKYWEGFKDREERPTWQR